MRRSGGYYYFLMSSLPALQWDAPPPFSSSDLLGMAGEWLSDREIAVLDRVRLAPEPVPECRVAMKWLAFETSLRNTLVSLRARRYGVPGDEYLRETPMEAGGIERRLAEIAKLDDPGERETALDRLRWDFLEEVAGTDPFTFDALAAYRLRLLLLEKRTQYDDQRGARVFDELAGRLSGEAAGVRRVMEHDENNL